MKDFAVNLRRFVLTLVCSCSEEVHLWAEAVRVKDHRESCCHLWVQICTLGLQLDPETHQQRDRTGRRDEDERETVFNRRSYLQCQCALCVQYVFVGYLSELAGGQSSWRRLWDRSQKKLLGRAQNLERLHLTIQFTDVRSEQCCRININMSCHLRLNHLIVREFTGCFKCVPVQEKLQQTDVAENSSVEEPWTTHSSLLQLGTLLEQQATHTRIVSHTYIGRVYFLFLHQLYFAHSRYKIL